MIIKTDYRNTMSTKINIKNIGQIVVEKIEDYNFNNTRDLFITKIFFKIIKIIYITLTRFTQDKCILHASALTYTSLLSLVPVLALMFSVLKGLAVKQYYRNMLVKLITANQKTVENAIISYLENVNAAKLGTIGALALFISAILVLTTIEKSFNVIWGVKNTRKTIRKLTDYLSALIIGPALFVAALSLSAIMKLPDFLKDIELIDKLFYTLIRQSPLLLLWCAFAFFYIFIPNTKVKIFPGIIGGLFASVLWLYAQTLYININSYMSNLKIIYGGLAALPIFLVWIYISWVILLFGAEVTFALQNVTNYRGAIENVKLSPQETMQVSIIVMYYVSKTFYAANANLQQSFSDTSQKQIAGSSISELASQLNLSERIINHVISNLYEAGLIIVDGFSQRQTIAPKKDPSLITIKEVINAVLHNKKKSIISSLEFDLDKNLFEKLEIFNKQDYILNLNLKAMVKEKCVQ